MWRFFFVFNVQYYHVPWRWPSARGQSHSIVCHRHRQGNASMIPSDFWPESDLAIENFELHVLFDCSMYTQEGNQEPKRRIINTRFIKTQAGNSYQSVGASRERFFCLHNNRWLFFSLFFRWDMTHNQTFSVVSLIKVGADTETRHKLCPHFDRCPKGGLKVTLCHEKRSKSRDNRDSVIYPKRRKNRSQNKIGSSTPRKWLNWLIRFHFGALEHFSIDRVLLITGFRHQ